MNKKIKIIKVFRIDVAPEGNFEDFRDMDRISYSKTIYDENGNIAEEFKFDDFGEQIGKILYKHNSKGHLIGEETYNELDDLEEKISFERDDNGNILKKFVHYLDDTVDTINYEYNENKLVRIVLIDEDGEIESDEKFAYEGDNLISQEKFEEGELVQKQSFIYDEKGNVTEANMLTDGEQVILVNEFDEKGNRIKTLKYDEDDKPIEKALMIYDEHGNMIEIVEEDPYKKNTIQISYDENGNATGQKQLNRAGGTINEVNRDYDANGNLTEVRAVIMGQDQKPERKYILAYDYEYFDL